MINNICRAKRVDTQEWVIGYYVFDQHDMIVENLAFQASAMPKLVNAHVVSEETLGRSTHRNDKNNNQIFEGDIISFLGNWKYIVRYGGFNKSVGLGYYYGLGFYLERIGDPEHLVPFNVIDCKEKWYEVVGNIYDNKELLDGNETDPY